MRMLGPLGLGAVLAGMLALAGCAAPPPEGYAYAGPGYYYGYPAYDADWGDPYFYDGWPYGAGFGWWSGGYGGWYRGWGHGGWGHGGFHGGGHGGGHGH